jgi:hypothetical protein
MEGTRIEPLPPRTGTPPPLGAGCGWRRCSLGGTHSTTVVRMKTRDAHSFGSCPRGLIGGGLGDLVGVEDAPTVPDPTVEPELADLDHVRRWQRQTEQFRMHTVWAQSHRNEFMFTPSGLSRSAIGSSNVGWLLIPSGLNSSRRACECRHAGGLSQHASSDVIERPQ